MHPSLLRSQIDQIKNSILKRQHHWPGDPTFIPILLTGGIGDSILARRTLINLMQEGHELLVYSPHAVALRRFYPDIQIHQGPLPNFTWHLNLDSVAQFKFSPHFGGFMLYEHKKLFDQQQSFFRMNPEMSIFVNQHSGYKYVMTDLAKERGLNAATFPLYSLGTQPSPQQRHLRNPIWKKQITIHDGYDASSLPSVHGRATKQWKWTHWNELVRDLRIQFPDHEIIQLGTKTSRAIDGVDQNLINETTINEAFDILSESRFHIDTDSGLVHAATAMGVPCVVMFGPTPASFYGHPENLNLTSSESCSGGCFFLTPNWMDRCPIGYSEPRCMDDITPEQVLYAITKTPGFLGPGV